MAKQPNHRYPDARTLIKDLKSVAQALEQNPDAMAVFSLEDFGTVGEPRTGVSSGRLHWFFQWRVKRHLAALLFASLFVGSASAGIGWWMRPGDPLKSPPPKTTKQVPKLKTAAEQYLRAAFLEDDEDAWLAVEQFPDDHLYVHRAQVRLASLYLRTNRHQEAKAIYDQLALLGEGNGHGSKQGNTFQGPIASFQSTHQRPRRLHFVP